MVSLHHLGLLALTKICSQPHNSLPGIFHYFATDSLRQACARFNTTAMSSISNEPITAPFGTWKSPLESETVYQKSSSITGLLVDVKTGKVFHTEVRLLQCIS